jgi:hypothetical protein
MPSTLIPEQTTDTTDSKPKARAVIAQTRPTGQKRSLERGKGTRKKNPGKRAHQGGG